MGVVTFGRLEVGEVISDRFYRPGVAESLACETPVHLSDDGVETLWVTRGRIVHYCVPVELRVSVRNSLRVHEFHSLNGEHL